MKLNQFLVLNSFSELSMVVYHFNLQETYIAHCVSKTFDQETYLIQNV